MQDARGSSRDVARVLAHVHGKNVRHADLSGRNLLLDADRRILLCDFAGSSINGQAATVVAEDGYRHPSESEYTGPTLRCEIHTLGSTMYEIITGKEPHHDSDKEAAGRLLEQGEYPDVSKVPLGEVVRKCWAGALESGAEVAQEISRCLNGIVGRQVWG
ncbi:kinase-like protein [Parachaetomium inaequale]|uniref:EKC/KEOPS complex subunit BUD32 n=1 Tax=Parachaetomium inaequale TaxID=2588326 RepID=A0AAN6PCC0_9PEZI|nr:kinase-like protein [Parachaetomium inaequale]